MAQFKFRWQVLLSLRERERDERRYDLATACALERDLAERRNEIVGQQARHQVQRRQELSAGNVSIDALRRCAQFENHLRERFLAADQAVTAATADTESCREHLAEAERQVRVLEKLRERRRGEFSAAAARSETRTLDEVGARLASFDARVDADSR